MRLLIAVALASAPAAVAAQQFELIQKPLATAPTTAEAALERFIAAMQAPGSTEKFVASNFTATALNAESAAERAKAFDALKAEARGLEVRELSPTGDRTVEALAVSRNGKASAKIILSTSAEEPGKIAELTVLSTAFPEAP